MLAKKITYEDYNGVQHTETFYFHLSKAKLAELQFSVAGGYSEMLQRLVDSSDTPAVMREFKNLLKATYGKRSDDGKRFVQSDELWEEFEQSNAYGELLYELLSDVEYAAKFFSEVVPSTNKAAAQDVVKDVLGPAI